MIVTYYPLESPAYFAFEPWNVGDHFCSVYQKGSKIFDYLNKKLKPTDIKIVRSECHTDKTYVCLIYKLKDAILKDMPPFTKQTDLIDLTD